jgi:hypothetical protein
MDVVQNPILILLKELYDLAEGTKVLIDINKIKLVYDEIDKFRTSDQFIYRHSMYVYNNLQYIRDEVEKGYAVSDVIDGLFEESLDQNAEYEYIYEFAMRGYI